MKIIKTCILTASIALSAMVPGLASAQCDLVAKVFETEICYADIALDPRPEGVEPWSPDMKSRQENGRLAAQIRSIAATHLLSKESYTPTAEEIDSYLAFHEKAKSLQDQQDRELVETIETLLNTYEYTEGNRKRLQNGLETFRKSIEMTAQIAADDQLMREDMRERFGEEALKQFEEERIPRRRNMAAGIVSAWKMNKALYDKYGGRIIFQQFGIEPIDAYRDHLADIRETGGLIIYKPAFSDVFLEFENYLDMGHNFLDDDDGTLFDLPYWETADPNAAHLEAINEYKAIPHK